MCLVFVGHPLDTVRINAPWLPCETKRSVPQIKVRLQTSTQYSGMFDCFKQTVQKEGVKVGGCPLLVP